MPEEFHQKLRFREKAGYSFGDGAANFVFQTMLIFQLGYYTDTVGISAAAAGTLLLVGRFWDAFFDPLMGIVADRTNTRWGKFRPWLLWSAIPFALMFWLTFTTPHHLHYAGTLIYAYVTYILLMSAYSMNNLPYSALNGVITGDVNERTSLSSFRFFAAMAAAFLVQGLTLPLVGKFGNGSSARGWSITIGIESLIAIVFFVIVFFSVRERIHPPPGQKMSVKQDFRDLSKNKPWLSMFVLTLTLFITLAMWGTATFYYFKYYVNPDAAFDFLKSWGLVTTTSGGAPAGWWHHVLNAFGLLAKPDHSNADSVGFSLFNMVGMGANILGVLCSKWLSERFGKKTVFLVGLFLTSVFTGLFILLPASAVGWTFTLNLLKSLAYGPTIPLLWAMMADVADYSEWKSMRRATGFVFAGIVFALKAGLGLGGAICGWLLALYGYVPNAVQTAHALFGIRMTSSIYSAIMFFVGVVALAFYGIDKRLNLQIQDELAERRKHFTPQTPSSEAL